MPHLIELHLHRPDKQPGTTKVERYVLSDPVYENAKTTCEMIELELRVAVFGHETNPYATLIVADKLRTLRGYNYTGLGFANVASVIVAAVQKHVLSLETPEAPAPSKPEQPGIKFNDTVSAENLVESLDNLWCAAFDQAPIFSDCSPRFGFRHTDGEISFCTMKDVLESGNPRNDSDGEDNAEYLGMLPITIGLVVSDGVFAEMQTDNNVAVDIHFYDKTDLTSTCLYKKLACLEQGMEVLELYTAKQITPEFFSWSVSQLPQDMWHRFRSMADTMLAVREKAAAASFED